MISKFKIVLVFLFVLPLIVTGQSKPSMENVAWIAGCWQAADDPGSVEQWMRPAGNMMMGMSRTVMNGKVVAYEFLQIRQDANGDLYYIAKPHNKPETPFKLVIGTPTESVFENPDLSFPRRIIYRHENDGSLFARIEGTENGKQKAIDFPMKRVKCD
ncbi:MAG TPA: DUF6265 family protein [Blastocatellia bacterium]|nr:DUF6265 family protein [Blastocatellia bacterium]